MQFEYILKSQKGMALHRDKILSHTGFEPPMKLDPRLASQWSIPLSYRGICQEHWHELASTRIFKKYKL